VNFAVIDIVFAVVILVLTVRGLLRGFIEEVFSLGALVLGLAAAVLFSGSLARPVEQTFGIPAGWGQVVAFLAVFLVVYIVLKLVEKALHGLAEKVQLENLDKALGFIFGLLEGMVFVALAILVLRLQPFFNVDGLFRGSLTGRYLLPLVLAAADVFKLKPVFPGK
jgi:membrane protein required for colicin V production